MEEEEIQKLIDQRKKEGYLMFPFEDKIALAKWYSVTKKTIKKQRKLSVLYIQP